MTLNFTPRTTPFLELLKIAKKGLTAKEVSIIFSMEAGSKLLRLKELLWVTREKNEENVYEYKISNVGIKKLMFLRNREKQKISEGKDSS